MLKISIFIIIVFWVAGCCQTPATGIRVHVDGLMDKDSVVTVITRDSTYMLVLDSTRSAEVYVSKEQKADYATCRYHGITVPIYIEPGESFEIFLKIKDWNLDVGFTGVGAPKNEYLNNKTLREFYPDYKTDETGFLKNLNASERKLMCILDSINFDSLFVATEKNRIHYLVYSFLPNYPSFRKRQPGHEMYEPSQEFYIQLREIIREEEKYLNMPEYRTAITNLINAFGSKGLKEPNEWRFLENQMNYIEKRINNQLIKDFLMDKVTTRYVERKGTDHLEEIVGFYHANVESSDKKQKFDKLCHTWLKLVKGKPSPIFRGEDIEGKEVSLEDLLGKYIYIDIWATWCRPCRGEFPYLEKLIHRYENKNISFVSLSSDQNKKDWEKTIKNEKLAGIQLYCGKGNDFIEAYVVRSIPRFILLDRAGNIIQADMTRPSDPETIKILDGLEGI